MNNNERKILTFITDHNMKLDDWKCNEGFYRRFVLFLFDLTRAYYA